MRVVAPLRPLRVVVVFRPVGLDHLVQLDERGGEGEVDDVGGHHVERELLPVGRPDPPQAPVAGALPRVEERLPGGERAVEVEPRDERGGLALPGEAVLEVQVAGGNCIKISLPGNRFSDYFQENRTSRSHFLLL